MEYLQRFPYFRFEQGHLKISHPNLYIHLLKHEQGYQPNLYLLVGLRKVQIYSLVHHIKWDLCHQDQKITWSY